MYFIPKQLSLAFLHCNTELLTVLWGNPSINKLFLIFCVQFSRLCEGSWQLMLEVANVIVNLSVKSLLYCSV